MPASSKKEPRGHSEQKVAPVVLLYVPGAHSSHSGMPARGCAEVGRQSEQADDCARLAEPGSHLTHCSAAVAPSAGCAVPAGHAMQSAGDVEPVLGLYVPTGHSVGIAMPPIRGAVSRMPY